MSKKIRTTDTDITVKASTIDVIEIGTFSFEKDERYPWVDIYLIGKEEKEFVKQVEEGDKGIISSEDLRIFALNWFFNNVEIVKNEDNNNGI